MKIWLLSLILSMDGLVLKEIPLTKERTTIGRKPHNDIQIDNLAISGEHAVIVTILNDSFLEDLNSTNGTFVNGQADQETFPAEQRRHRVGQVQAQIHQRDAVADHGRGFREDDGAIDTQAGMKPAQSAATAAPAPSPPQAMPTGAIQVLTGANAGKELELTKNLTTLGKPGVQVAVITRRPHGYFITHVEGANFPVVNGATLDAHPRELKDHDVIELAGVKMEFFLKS
jgi:hypothetical protein